MRAIQRRWRNERAGRRPSGGSGSRSAADLPAADQAAPLADPYPLHARLRDTAPFLPVRFPGVRAAYLVSTFASCSRLLRDPAFGPPSYAQLDAMNPGWRDNAFTRCLYRSMVFRAGPGHRERRQVAARHFTPRQIGTYRAELDEIAGMLLDRLAEHGPGPVDLVEQLALPFASLSLGRLLAIPDDEAIRLGRLARRVGAAFEQFASREQHRIVALAGEELVRRLAVIVTGRGGGDGARDNLLASLAASQAGADEQEQLGAAVLLFGAGFDSSASMVGLGTKLLLDHPPQACLVAEEAATTSRAVAEILRYEPPVQLVVRVALEPAELVDGQIGAGSVVIGLIAAANRDPAQVKEPEAFEVTREQVPSLSFGAGPHYCLGAYLAGLQGEVLFPRMLRRFPGLRLAGQPVYRSPGSTLRGLEHLPLYVTS
ncbi:MAG TPA: cytochrome P450 [Streptosporangiaceae bacterium]